MVRGSIDDDVMQALHWSFLSYRYEEHAGADAEVASAIGDDPGLLEVRQVLGLRSWAS